MFVAVLLSSHERMLMYQKYFVGSMPLLTFNPSLLIFGVPEDLVSAKVFKKCKAKITSDG